MIKSLLLFPLLLMVTLLGSAASESTKKQSADAAAAARLVKPTLFLVGDSTVRSTEGDGIGWGTVLQSEFDSSRISVANEAIGGRSTRSYLREGHWAKVLGALKPGDIVILDFGHNDESPLDDSRSAGTLPGTGPETKTVKLPPGALPAATPAPTPELGAHPGAKTVFVKSGEPPTHEIVHTFGAYLRLYIKQAKARGAAVIVCSPVPKNNWSQGHVIRNTDTYGGWAKEIAYQTRTPFVDLNDLIANRYDSMGEAEVKPLFVADNIHTTMDGAKLNAFLLTESLRAQIDCPLADFLK